MGRNVIPQQAASQRGPAQGQPGSNGYWRRDQFNRPGTYTWTAKKAGKIKFQALGAAAGGRGSYPGASGAYGDKEITVAAGDTYTIVVGTGGTGGTENTATAVTSGTTTSITGPGLASPLVLVGATCVNTLAGTMGVAGTATGPWDKSFPGAIPIGRQTGSPSSGSPFGPGFASAGKGGAGWGGPGGSGQSGTQSFGGSSHYSALGVFSIQPPPGLSTFGVVLTPNASTSLAGSPTNDNSIRPFWDMDSVDSAGGGFAGNLTNSYPAAAGPGAGTAGGQIGIAASALGGGCGEPTQSTNPVGFRSGPGGGGAACGADQFSSGTGGEGGNAIVFVFFDEVAA